MANTGSIPGTVARYCYDTATWDDYPADFSGTTRIIAVPLTSSAKRAESSPRRGVVAAFASAVVPGWGQVYAGAPEKGRQLLLVDAVIFATFIVGLAILRLDVLKLWVSTTALALMMVANLVLLGYRWLAALDAYHEAPDHSLPRWQANLAIAAIVAVLVVPHVAFGYVNVTQYSLINSLFGGDGGPVAAPEPTTTLPPSSTLPGGTPPTTVAGATTTTTGPTLWDGLERLNILLLGADAGAGRRGLRTDTTILVSIDPAGGDISMFSVPRDFSGAPLPEGMGSWDCDCYPEIITSLYDAAESDPESFPGPNNPGINAVKGAVGRIFDVPVHYYALVTLDGFVDIVDALGGVTIEIPVEIVDEQYPHEDGSVESITIPAGTRHLDGHQALAYARIRRQSNDFARMHRQRCVLEAVLEQSSPTEILFRFGAIAEALKRSLSTDIPEERLGDFIDLLPKISTDRVASLRITRAEYKIGEGPGRVFYDIDRLRADAKALMEDPEVALAELGLDSLDETCGEGSENPSSGL